MACRRTPLVRKKRLMLILLTADIEATRRMTMSEYTVKPIDTFRQWSNNAAPLSRDDYEALAHPSRATSVTPPDTVDLNSSSLSNLIGSLQSYSGQWAGSTGSLVGTLTPSASSGYSSGLYAGVGQLSAPQMQSLINGYV